MSGQQSGIRAQSVVNRLARSDRQSDIRSKELYLSSQALKGQLQEWLDVQDAIQELNGSKPSIRITEQSSRITHQDERMTNQDHRIDNLEHGHAGEGSGDVGDAQRNMQAAHDSLDRDGEEMDRRDVRRGRTVHRAIIGTVVFLIATVTTAVVLVMAQGTHTPCMTITDSNGAATTQCHLQNHVRIVWTVKGAKTCPKPNTNSGPESPLVSLEGTYDGQSGYPAFAICSPRSAMPINQAVIWFSQGRFGSVEFVGTGHDYSAIQMGSRLQSVAVVIQAPSLNSGRGRLYSVQERAVDSKPWSNLQSTPASRWTAETVSVAK